VERREEVPGVRRRKPEENIEDAGGADESVKPDCVSANDEILNAAGVERSREIGEIGVQLLDR
jgi:hypothetical protein